MPAAFARLFIEFDDGANVVYTYDDRYQLLMETRYTSTAQTTGVYRYTWTYDDAGNRLTQLKEEWDSGWEDKSYTEYTYNAANQLTEDSRWDDDDYTTLEAETDYAYDDAGNMTDKTYDDKIGSDDADWDYTYNYENRQTKVEKDTGGGMTEVGEYTYNVTGNRVQREVNQTTTWKMYYDGADCVGDYDGTSTRYFMTPGLDENLLMNDGSDYFYTQDGLGSVRELLNTNQATQNSYDYEAFGAFYGTPTENVTNSFTYTGREWDSEYQTYYYRARQYDQHTGRFSSRDPVEHVNLYFYCKEMPTILSDPMGSNALQFKDIETFKASTLTGEGVFHTNQLDKTEGTLVAKWECEIDCKLKKSVSKDCVTIYQEYKFTKYNVPEEKKEMPGDLGKVGVWYTDLPKGIENYEPARMLTGDFGPVKYPVDGNTTNHLYSLDHPGVRVPISKSDIKKVHVVLDLATFLVTTEPNQPHFLKEKIAVLVWQVEVRNGKVYAGQAASFARAQGNVVLNRPPWHKEVMKKILRTDGE